MMLKAISKAMCLLSPKSKSLVIISLATINTEQLRTQALHHFLVLSDHGESVTSRAGCIA